MRIVLVGNYRKDKQESMERFALMMETGFKNAGYTVDIWRPTVFFGSFFKATTGGIPKWIGYLDKWILFPLVLRMKRLFGSADTLYHVCDHSNSFYVRHLPDARTSITCHDVLAIRGGLGYADAYAPASGFGKYMQRWILSNLLTAKKIACVSQLTLNQLNDLAAAKGKKPAAWQVIHNGFNADFSPLGKEECRELLRGTGVNIDEPFILHVGSRQLRKNRQMLIEMVHELGDKYTGKIVYAGFDIEPSLYSYADKLGLKDRLISVTKPPHKVLKALYSSCYAFIFPSLSEGFGWPVIEAQACGTAVVASSTEPMPEVSGGAALHADPTKPEEFANALLQLSDSSLRAELIRKGKLNVTRFTPDIMINAYLSMLGIGANTGNAGVQGHNRPVAV
ncbi:glycosyltransferase family 4 protein [Chitinophaga rhizophila]|uniref:Glycosyltransferase family 4 protein n=1 Tax=Chitinophaga rhizophila TaxID=2866212 RepID=A0ABS7G8M5_9BACT|nr:glycosyltransferase family 1 protein [Chitinophaga rhizophila]MBW8683655.1 glycosyltransferase family 4 protein [Chitinophaga rhizophila]